MVSIFPRLQATSIAWRIARSTRLGDLDEHVLGPLGMTASTADPVRAEALGMAPGHRDWFGLHLADGFRHVLVEVARVRLARRALDDAPEQVVVRIRVRERAERVAQLPVGGLRERCRPKVMICIL